MRIPNLPKKVVLPADLEAELIDAMNGWRCLYTAGNQIYLKLVEKALAEVYGGIATSRILFRTVQSPYSPAHQIECSSEDLELFATSVVFTQMEAFAIAYYKALCDMKDE